jgi:membrane protein
MNRFMDRLARAGGRVFPACITQAQAVAFNIFLAFFPSLLFALGVLSIWDFLHHAGRALIATTRLIFPAGTSEIVMAYFTERGLHSWRWIALGLGGTLLTGSQVMITLAEGVRKIEGVPEPPGFVRRQVHALVLLMMMMVPWLVVVILTVFGRQFRRWLIAMFGWPELLNVVGAGGYFGFVMALGFCVLLIFYHRSLVRHRGWRSLVPGAMVATVLWWLVDVSLGLYFLHVPYRVVYGELAAAIGLIIWMYLTALVVFFGAAYNAEMAAEEAKRRAHA